jgi:hypothetical protein
MRIWPSSEALIENGKWVVVTSCLPRALDGALKRDAIRNARSTPEYLEAVFDAFKVGISL